ncbi:hypothetical protein [Dictyobacter aurantiacus]|uniref:CHRD domain-containing protein n=1 Tax=Dictyobacter aurantiacus TaxID=1936993 RepID=A0A401ZN33_9CHLR|nr:hypothetical protein [Dictyobacter aurantiacus]GCE08288.1 hypothetical protein KDAU_56170 [Dictyobacter aurantiacus]
MRYALFRLLLALLCSAMLMTSGVAFAHEQRLPPGAFSPGRFPPGRFPPGNVQQGNLQQNGFIIVQTQTSMVPTSAAADLAVTCPAGRIATGGGGAIGTGGIQGGSITTTGPFPAANLNDPTGWHVIVTNLTGAAQPVTAWVLCVRTS